MRIVRKFELQPGKTGHRHLVNSRGNSAPIPAGRLPRLTRLLALAIRFEELLRSGLVSDQAAIARWGSVTRARITQIMNLLHLAPDIQEAILFLPRIDQGKDPLHLKGVLPIAAEPDWQVQRERWAQLLQKL